MRWAYARVRLSEIRALENKGVGIVVKRLEFKAMIEFIQIVLAAVINRSAVLDGLLFALVLTFSSFFVFSVRFLFLAVLGRSFCCYCARRGRLVRLVFEN